MELSEIREKIDAVDEQLLDLFLQRMDLSDEVAAYKNAHHLPILNKERERAILAKVTEKSGERERYAYHLFSTLFELARSRQAELISAPTKVAAQVRASLEAGTSVFPQTGLVACQGVEGAYSQQACDKLFALPSIMYFKRFEGVFQAIESGLCRYGVLPIVNSSYGSVTEVYDLMRRYRFSIVRSVRLKIDHCLLARPGAQLSDIKEIYSHEQAISQCSRFLQGLPGVTVVRCENTAAAAKRVAESGRTDVAALASRACIGLYGLESLAASVQDQGNNYTRFVCIAKDLEIYPGADRTSLMMVLPHKPGSLYKVLSRFYALGINLNKLESRPLPERDFEFMFYFDLETSVYSPQFRQLMGELPGLCEEFSYLGSYQEVV